EHAESEQHAATAEIADQVERRNRLAARRTDQVQGARERDVVDVVAGRGRERTVLTPTCHPTVHELWIALQTRLGPETQAFEHAGAETLDEDVGTRYQLQHCVDG